MSQWDEENVLDDRKKKEEKKKVEEEKIERNEYRMKITKGKRWKKREVRFKGGYEEIAWVKQEGVLTKKDE